MTEYSNPLLNERETAHGDWRHTAALAQGIKDNWRNCRSLSESQREALDMIATKIARILSGNADEPDHWRDIAGYATLAAEHLVYPREQVRPAGGIVAPGSNGE